ncbi:MAG TPA: right-handed parallel beta-helix repeat-containing protein [Methylomirabilota bacterium]|nr:right-handed parallel beta-helix repeat-containing protein [Methylomirabilota bacterium]
MRTAPSPRSHGSCSLGIALLALCLLASALAPSPADAKRIFVPREHKRLQAAIDAAAAGDTIWVSPGTYYGPFVIKKRLVLFGDGGPEKTILDGHDSVRVLHVEGATGAGIFGFRVQNGKAPGGSGIYCLQDTAFQIGSCDIRGNWEAGVAAWRTNLLQIADTEISGNHGSGLTASDTRLQLLRVTFRDNHAPSGGAMALASTDLMVARDCLFESNRADDGTGGGIFAESSPVKMTNCTFRQNTAAAGGGGIAVRDSTDLRIRYCTFAENRSSSGGAVLTDASSVDIQFSIFNKNRAKAAGAAVQILGRRTPGVNPFLINNTFYRNGVDDEGGTVFSADVAPEITRNIFVVDSTAKNKAVFELKGVPRYECNLMYATDGPGVPPTANTIVGNPSFCNAEKGDFHVRDLSPALLAPCGKLGAMGKGCTSFRLLPSQ